MQYSHVIQAVAHRLARAWLLACILRLCMYFAQVPFLLDKTG